MAKIKLKPKQLAALTQLQSEKAQLSKIYQELNQKESLIVELIFEENGIDSVDLISSLKLDAGCLEYELKVEPDKSKKKKRAEDAPQT